MITPTVNKGKPDLMKKVMPAIIVGKPWHRKGVVNMYFEANVVVIVSPKGETRKGLQSLAQLEKSVLIFDLGSLVCCQCYCVKVHLPSNL